MAVSFFLKTPKAEKSAIYIRCFLRGEKYRTTTKISIDPKLWNPNTQAVRDVRGFASAKVFNNRLREMRDAAEKVQDEVMAEAVMPTPTEFWDRVYKKLDGVAPRVDMTFTEYLGEYAQRRKVTHAINTAKQYFTAHRHLCEYEKHYHTKISFSDISLKFYIHFREFMLNQGYSLNTLGTTVKSIKVAYRDAREVDGLHDLHETEKRGFSSANYAAKTVYLSLDELQRIADLEITPETILAAFPELQKEDKSILANLRRKAESLNIIRNKFLLGAYTALRVSDFNHLRDVHIDGDYFRVTTQKTGALVVIPIHPVIRRMMDNGFDISTPITEQKINKHIKEIAKMADITQVVEGTKYIDHRAVIGFFPKYEMITTHTARRSAATNMFKAGIPAISIMRITGHTTEKAFMKYIKITAEENALMMAKNKFFTE